LQLLQWVNATVLPKQLCKRLQAAHHALVVVSSVMIDLKKHIFSPLALLDVFPALQLLTCEFGRRRATRSCIMAFSLLEPTFVMLCCDALSNGRMQCCSASARNGQTPPSSMQCMQCSQ
jgi:hypothetical protein